MCLHGGVYNEYAPIMLADGKKIGGAPANFAYPVSQFGLDSCVVSALPAELTE